MAASLAHEINNPLTSIINGIYMASSCRELPASVQHYLDIARENSDRVARIARHMLGLYRTPLQPEAVHLRHLLQDVIHECRAKAEERQQKFDIDLDWPGSVLGFADELRQALMNLVQNAVEHSPAGGTIAIRAHRARSFQWPAERGVRVLVANAAAKPLKGFDRIDPFISTKPQRGSGLGLWVTRSVVIKHGGKLRIRAYGAGMDRMCCVVYLPMRPPQLRAAAGLAGC
jgi:signal transduction histidine kinase